MAKAYIWRVDQRSHDQKVRMGVTQEPLIDFDQISMLSPLHSFMRFFDMILKIIYHLNAGIFKWSDDKNVLGSSFQLLKTSKDNVKAIIKEKTDLSVDVPDSTGKGVHQPPVISSILLYPMNVTSRFWFLLNLQDF